MSLWKIEIKGVEGSWQENQSVSFRNISGVACGNVRIPDFDSLQTPPYAGTGIPGLFRCTIKPDSIIAGVSAVVLKNVETIWDRKHPDIDITTGKVCVLDDWTEQAFDSVDLYLNSSVIESDVFEIGIGYAYDSTAITWKPICAAGIGFPGYQATNAFVRLTNESSRDQVLSKVMWSNSGTFTNIWRARLSGGIWTTAGVSELYFNAEGSPEGVVPIGESAIIEFQPMIPSGATAEDNLVIATFQFYSVSV
jgi:hypothetical protein